mgnify:FL=1
MKKALSIIASILTIAGLGVGIYRSLRTPPGAAQSPPAAVKNASGDDALYADDDESRDGGGYSDPTPSASLKGQPADMGENAPDNPPADAAPLNEEQVLRQAASLSDSPLWAKWLAQDNACRRLLRAMDDIAQGQRPVAALDFMAVPQPFSAQQNADGALAISPAAIARYQPIAEVILAIPPEKWVQCYLLAEPLLQEQYRQMGSREPVRTLLASFCNAILEIPDFNYEPELVRMNGGLYQYKDPAFEQLTDGQKLIIRLGCRNCARIRQLCQAIADELKLLNNP